MNNKYWLGIDVGSTACKIVILNENNEIIKRARKNIETTPLKVVYEVLNELDEYVKYVQAIGITGSCRMLISKFLDADIIKSELIAHAKGCMNCFSDVENIIEIGGQDSKYLMVSNGILSNYRMNSMCAAASGAFLDMQAKRMGIRLHEFDELALTSTNRIELSGKCIVFTESEIIAQQRIGVEKADIAMAISRNIARNYINTLIMNKKIEGKVVFQGGVAKLKSVRKAFEEVLDTEIIVPEYPQYMGAYGIALLAKDGKNLRKTKKSMLDPSEMEYSLIVCDGCNSKCQLGRYVNRVSKEEIRVGGRCGKY